MLPSPRSRPFPITPWRLRSLACLFIPLINSLETCNSYHCLTHVASYPMTCIYMKHSIFLCPPPSVRPDTVTRLTWRHQQPYHLRKILIPWVPFSGHHHHQSFQFSFSSSPTATIPQPTGPSAHPLCHFSTIYLHAFAPLFVFSCPSHGLRSLACHLPGKATHKLGPVLLVNLIMGAGLPLCALLPSLPSR